jgi:hypothetical protein
MPSPEKLSSYSLDARTYLSTVAIWIAHRTREDWTLRWDVELKNQANDLWERMTQDDRELCSHFLDRIHHFPHHSAPHGFKDGGK